MSILSPDYDWFQKIPSAQEYELFRRFKVFGENIGKDHLAFWFYTTGRMNYGPLVDTVVTAVIEASLDSKEKVHQFITDTFKGTDLGASRGGYDIRRARLLCALYDLAYGRGPYVAFYSQKPTLPSWVHDPMGIQLVTKVVPTKPAAVLRFGGLSFERSLILLDELERHILALKQAHRELSWKQLWLRIDQWCEGKSAAVLRRIATKVLTDAAKRIT